MLYVVLVESDIFLRQTFDLIWTKNVKFAKKTKCVQWRIHGFFLVARKPPPPPVKIFLKSGVW